MLLEYCIILTLRGAQFILTFFKEERSLAVGGPFLGSLQVGLGPGRNNTELLLELLLAQPH